MSTGEKVVANRPFEYNPRPAPELDRGEIFVLRGARNDAKLIALRYIRYFDPLVDQQLKCDGCGRTFANDGARIGHKKKPNCVWPQSEQAPITRAETAESLGVDANKLIMSPD